MIRRIDPIRTRDICHNRSQSLSSGADPSTAVLRLDGSRPRRHAVGRHADYLAHAYACHDMALAADDACDQRALLAMSALWQALAQRTPVKQS